MKMIRGRCRGSESNNEKSSPTSITSSMTLALLLSSGGGISNLSTLIICSGAPGSLKEQEQEYDRIESIVPRRETRVEEIRKR